MGIYGTGPSSAIPERKSSGYPLVVQTLLGSVQHVYALLGCRDSHLHLDPSRRFCAYHRRLFSSTNPGCSFTDDQVDLGLDGRQDNLQSLEHPPQR